MRKKRKAVMAVVPLRKREPRAQRPYVVFQLQQIDRQHSGLE